MPDSLSPQPANASLALRAMTALGVSAIASLLASLPAVLRVVPYAHESGARVWLALAASWLVPMIVGVVLARGTRTALRAFAGPDNTSRAFAITIWFALLFVALVALGAGLRATAHNAALAGVTFAMFVVATALFLALVAARLAALVRGHSEWTQRAALTIAIALLAIAFFALVLRAPSVRPLAIDLLAFTIAATLASRNVFAESRSLLVAGPILAALLLMLGVATLRAAPLPAAILHDHAPAFLAPALAFQPAPT